MNKLRKKYRVVCGAAIVICKSLPEARKEAVKFNRSTIDGLIDYYDVKNKKWKSILLT